MILEPGSTHELREIRKKLLTAKNCDAKRSAENAFNTINQDRAVLIRRTALNQEKIDDLESLISNLTQRTP